MSRSSVIVAEKLKELLITSSPLIEDYTREICPACTDVCCRQKHGVFRERDITYLTALDLRVPAYDHERPAEGPCQFLAPTGCSLPRWQRPFKCTWYFCLQLLTAMDEGQRKKARGLSRTLEDMVRLYDELRDEPEVGG